jgi:serine/threonine protein kinase
MHRDLKLPNILLHFTDDDKIKKDSCTDKDFKLGDYIANFNFAENHKSLQCKIADLGFARKLSENELAETSCGTPLM